MSRAKLLAVVLIVFGIAAVAAGCVAAMITHRLLPTLAVALASRGGVDLNYTRFELAPGGFRVVDFRVLTRQAPVLELASAAFDVDLWNAAIATERLRISRGAVTAALRGRLRFYPKIIALLELSLPPTLCRDLLAATPLSFRPHLNGVVLAGRIAFEAKLVTNESRPGSTLLLADLTNGCLIERFGTVPRPEALRRSFSYTAYDAKRVPYARTTGPGTPEWTPVDALSPYLLDAVVVNEDFLFWQHRGVLTSRIATAIDIDLRERRARFGASTISMQLAKNLFLTRDKRFSRKAEELFFTWYLESHFSKNEILELYLNVAEFGPSIYGASAAARYYFGKQPVALSLREAAFLAKLLPRPIERHSDYLNGVVSADLERRIQASLRHMLDLKRITKDEYQRAKIATLTFRPQGTSPPASKASMPAPNAAVLAPTAPLHLETSPLMSQLQGDRDPLGQEVR